MFKRARDTHAQHTEVPAHKAKRARLWDDTEITEFNAEDEFYIGPALSNDNTSKPEGRFLDTLATKERKVLADEETRIMRLIGTNMPLRYRVLSLNAPDEVKVHALQMLKSYENDNENGASFLSAVENICQIPWGKYHELNVPVSSQSDFLDNSYRIMNEVIYGQDAAKLEMVEYLASYIKPGSKISQVIGLCGTHGVGKTTLGRNALSKALGDRPFYYITLGGSNDVSVLMGSQPVWKGSSCGHMVRAVISSGCMNPIIFFDELDKISETEGGKDIVSFLLHVTDPAQNSHVFDRFTGINVDLSRALIMFSYNDSSKISHILMDRIMEINMPGFTAEEKVVIARDYVLPGLYTELGMDLSKVQLNDQMIQYVNSLIPDTNEGVRPLSKVYKKLLRKLNVNMIVHTHNKKTTILKSKYSLGPVKLPTVITKQMIDCLLKKYR